MIISSVLVSSRLFDGLAAEDIESLASSAQVRELAPGDSVVRQGDEGDSLFIVASGEVEVYRKDASGAQRAIATLKPGEFFGEMSLIDWQPRSASVRAKTGAILVEINQDQLALLSKASHDAYDTVILNVARVLSERLRTANLRLV